MGPPNRSNLRIPYRGNAFPAGRVLNRSMGARPSSAQNRASNRGRNSNRDLYAARRRSFRNWYVNTYPAWPGYGYPYVIDPGFYDWGDSDDSADNEGGAAPYYPGPYSDYGYGAPGETPREGFAAESAPYQPSAAIEPAAPSVPGQTLTVIFRSGRAPVKMENYMMTARVLTDLDSRHYEQIPIDQIDIAATQQINGAAGVRFNIPGASRN